MASGATPSPLKLRDIAERLQCRLEGGASDGNVEIHRVAGIEHAGPGDLTFVANPRYQALIGRTRASAVILAPPKPGEPSAPRSCAVLRAENPYLAFARAVGPFVAIGAGASIGARTIVYPNVVIGAGARLGDDCVIHARVSVRERVVIGHRVIVQDGAVIGSDGFGFVKQADGTHFKIPQHADVVVEDDVEIGANTTIDRPAVGETRIRAGAKIDNLVQIAHGVSIGQRALLAAQVGIAGSTAIEDDVVLAGQVGVSGHLRIGKGAIATAQTGIPNSVDAGALVSGYPAIPNRDWLKASAIFRQLPDLRKRVADLEARLAALEGRSPARHGEE